jgi:hypothetical protein
MPTATALCYADLPDKAELTSAEVADLIGWSEGSLRLARSLGNRSGMTPPHRKRGRAVRYGTEELRAWMLERGYRPGSREFS